MEKKLFNLIYFLSLLLCCGPSQPEEATFTFYLGAPDIRHIALFETKIGKKIIDITGVTLEIEYPRGHEIQEQAHYLVTTGIFPDIIYGGAMTDFFYEKKVFIPLNDLIEKYGPNIKMYYADHLNKIKKADGNIYYLPSNIPPPEKYYGDSGFWLPVKLLKEFKWPRVKTFSQYIQLIREYARLNPAVSGKPVIGFTASTEGSRFFSLKNAPGRLLGYPDDGNFYVDPATLEAKLILSHPSAPDFYRALNELWLDDLLDREIFSQSYDQYLDKIASGRVIGFFDHYNQVFPAQRSLKTKSKMYLAHLPLPVVFEEVTQEHYNFREDIKRNQGTGITTACENPDRIIQFWDKFLEDEIQKIIFWGIEGEEHEIKEGKPFINPNEFRVINTQTYRDSTGLGRFTTGFPGRAYDQTLENGTALYPHYEQSLMISAYTIYESEALLAYKLNNWRDMFTPPEPGIYGSAKEITFPEEHPSNKTAAAYDSLAREYIASAIFADAGTFDSVWKQFQDQLNQLDLEGYCRDVTEKIRMRAETK